MDDNRVLESHYFILAKRLLKLMGIWPYQTETIKFYVRTTAIVLIHTMMIPQMIKLYTEWHAEDKEIEIIVENFTGFLYFQGVLSKLYMSIYAEKKLQHLYEQITRDFEAIRDTNERAAMEELWDFGRILITIYASYMFIACIFFVFIPSALPAIFDLIVPLNESRHKAICYYAEYFIDQNKYLYELILHTLVVVAITLIIISSVDTSFIIVTYHVLGLFNLITYRLTRLCEWANDHIHHDPEHLHNFVRETIRIHKKTLHLADLIRITYDECFFFVSALSLLAFSIGTIDVMMNLTNPQVILRIGFVWVGLLGYLFFTNWPGQRFLDSSEELADSVYSSNWYKLPVKTQFLMKFMMMRCTIPCQLTAGPLLQMNFANVGVILRMAMSCFTAATSLS